MADNEVEKLKRRLSELMGRARDHEDGLEEADRGRLAKRPTDFPARGWSDILKRSWGEVSTANLFLVAGGVTYSVLLALFPGLAALVSIYGLAFDPSQIEKQVAALNDILPEQALQMLSDELHSLVTASTGALKLSATVALLIALWSASRGMSGLMTSLASRTKNLNAVVLFG